MIPLPLAPVATICLLAGLKVSINVFALQVINYSEVESNRSLPRSKARSVGANYTFKLLHVAMIKFA